MRRLARILLNALTVLSLILCVATVALWVRSYWRTDLLLRTWEARPDAEGSRLTLVSALGRIAMQVETFSPESRLQGRAKSWYWISLDTGASASGWNSATNLWQFGYGTDRNRFARSVGLVFPTWLPMILFASVPATKFAISMRRRRRQRRQGLCPSCGYDLRATPERCPECGRDARA